MISGLDFRLLKAASSPFDKLHLGGLADDKTFAVSYLIESATSSGRFLIEDSTFEIMASLGMFLGTTAKFNPLARSEVSSEDSV